MRKLITVAVVGAVVAIGVAAAVEGLRGSSPEQAAPPGTTGAAATSAETSPTTDVTATTVTQEGPIATVPELNALADVLTTSEGGTDVQPKSAPAWKEETAVCRTRSFEILYDRELPAVLVLRGDRLLAWAGLYRRDVSDSCRDVRRKPPASTSDEPLPEGVYESVRLRCTAPAPIEIDAHAIEESGSVYGSLIYVAVAGTPVWLISGPVVKDIEGRRIYVNYKYCDRS